MALKSLSSAEAVRAAIAEYDRLGRAAFLDKYGFAEAREYFLLHDGKLYDSKAIVGAAHGFEHPDQGPLASTDFSGGEATVQAKLRSLGFEVIGASGPSVMDSEAALRAMVSLIGPPTSQPTKYLAAWRLRDGHELALQLQQKSARVWVDRPPPEIPGLQIQAYDAQETRHSHLAANAPSLAWPNVAYLCVARDEVALHQLVDWYVGNAEPGESFASLMSQVLARFATARGQPFRETPDLWASAEALKAKIASLPSVAARPDLLVKWSLGKGVWAKVPWIAILNRRVTTTTQQGLYVVFLIAEDLSRVYLTLNQGMTALVQELGQAGAGAEMRKRAAEYRQRAPELAAGGYRLDGEIDLRTEGWRSKNYEVGTVAHVELTPDALPSDKALNRQLEALLSAYDKLVEIAPPTDDRPCWFVGAVWGDDGDQTPRFLAEGIWESGWESGPVLEDVAEMQAGDRIAIKSSFPAPWGNADGGFGELRTRLDHAGVMDFRALDKAALHVWIERLGSWPAGMERTLDREALELGDAAIAAAKAKAEAEAAARRKQARSIEFNGSSRDPEETDWSSLEAELARSLPKSLLRTPLGQPAHLAAARPSVAGGPSGGSSGGFRFGGSGGQTFAPSAKTEMIGRLGELTVRNWLQARLPRQDIGAAWVSANAEPFTGRKGDDGLGYDFEISWQRQTWRIEVKASLNDPRAFELGETEVRAGRAAARSRSGLQYWIAYVSNLSDPASARIELIPNPLSEAGEAVLELAGEGLRYKFRRA